MTKNNHTYFVPISLKVGLKFCSRDLKLSFRLNLACLYLRAWIFKEIRALLWHLIYWGAYL